MSFEKRQFRRVNCDFEVEIHYRESRVFIAHARNLSTSGMYLRSLSLRIPTGMMVEMQFTLGGHRFALAALVVRQEDDGIGVMFREYQPALPRLMESLPAVSVDLDRATPPPLLRNDRLRRLSSEARL